MSAIQAKKLGEKYVLLDLVGIGGMAEVYRSKLLGDKGFEKQIVIKKLLPQIAQDKEMVRLFIGEARLAAFLQHENIATTYDFGEIDENFFLAMEYLFGKDLYTVLQKTRELKSPLGVKYALMIASKICEGMDYAHGLKDLQNKPLNIIHRDLTPHNIFVTYDGKIKIFDFGIAKAEILDNRTRAGVVKGKLSYMSPEQLSGEVIDFRSDIFSIGILLYEMLSGKRMYSGDTAALIKKCITVDYEHLKNIVSGLPPELYALLDKALTRDLESRYQSCSDMQADIDNLLFSMSERPDSKSLANYTRNLFAQEYEFDQKKAIVAMEATADTPTHSGQNKTVTFGPDSAEKTVTYNTHQDSNPGGLSFLCHGIASKLLSDKRFVFIVSSVCLVALVAFLLPAFFKKDSPTDLSSLVGQEVTAHADAPPGQATVRHHPQQDEKVLAGDGEEDKRKQERLREEKKALQRIENRYVDQVGKDLAEQRFSEAEGYVKAGLSAYPDNQVLQRLVEKVAGEKQTFIAELYNKAEARLAANRLTTPADDSALLYYNKIKEVDPYSAQVQAGLQKIADRYASIADLAYRKFNFRSAEEYVKKGLMVVPGHSRLLTLKRDLTKSKPEIFFKGLEKNIDALFFD
jgi:serine/threonine protein kinase